MLSTAPSPQCVDVLQFAVPTPRPEQLLLVARPVVLVGSTSRRFQLRLSAGAQ